MCDSGSLESSFDQKKTEETPQSRQHFTAQLQGKAETAAGTHRETTCRRGITPSSVFEKTESHETVPPTPAASDGDSTSRSGAEIPGGAGEQGSAGDSESVERTQRETPLPAAQTHPQTTQSCCHAAESRSAFF